MGTSSAMLCDLGKIFLLVDLQIFFRFSVGGGESSENDQITGQFQSFFNKWSFSELFLYLHNKQ